MRTFLRICVRMSMIVLEDRRIGGEEKAAMKHLETRKLVMLRKELSEDLLRPSCHKARSEIRSVVHNVAEQVLLDPLRRVVPGETLHTHIERFFDTDVACNWILKKLLTSSSLMTPIPTLVRRKTDSYITGQSTVLTKASKKEPVALTEEYGDNIRSLLSQSDSGGEEFHCSRSS